MVKILLLAVFQPIFASILPETFQLPLVQKNDKTLDDLALESRISYARSVHISECPYFARLQRCAGAILTEEWVVTAAHCVTPPENTSKYVSVGNGCAEIKDIIIHPGYMTTNGIPINDIALVRLTEPLEFNATVQPVKLPYENQEFEAGVKHEFVGMGVDETGWQSPYPKKVEAMLNPTEDCYPESYRPVPKSIGRLKRIMNDTTICAMRVDRPGLANTGDFGGPVVKDNVLVGLASYVLYPLQYNYTVFLTNVAYYVDWITHYIEYVDTEEEYDSSSEELLMKMIRHFYRDLAKI